MGGLVSTVWIGWLGTDASWLLGFLPLWPEGRPKPWLAMGGLLALLCLLFNIGGGMGGFIAAIMYGFVSVYASSMSKMRTQTGATLEKLEDQLASVANVGGGEQVSQLLTQNAKLLARVNELEAARISAVDQAEVTRLRDLADRASKAAEAALSEKEAASADCERLRTSLSRFRRQQRVLSNAYQDKEAEYQELQDKLSEQQQVLGNSLAGVDKMVDDSSELEMALRITTSNLETSQKQMAEQNRALQDKQTMVEQLQAKLYAAEDERNQINNRLAQFEDVVAELDHCKAELSDMTDEVFELQTLVEALKRKQLDAEAGLTPSAPTPNQALSRREREDLILSRVKRSPFGAAT